MKADARIILLAFLSLILVAGSFSRFPVSISGLIPNADFYYMEGVYRDVFVSGIGLSGWYLQPGPGFLPDMLLFFPARFVLGDYISAIAFFQLAVLLLLVGVMTALAKSLSQDDASSFDIALLSGLVMIVFDNLWGCSLFKFMIVPGYHEGSILLGGLLLLSSLRILKGGGVMLDYLSFFTVSLVGAISDPILIPQFMIPVLVSFIVLSLLGLVRGRIALIISSVTIAVVALHQLSFNLFGYYGIFIHKPQSFASVYLSLGYVVTEVYGFLFQSSQEYCSIAGHILALACLIVSAYRMISFYMNSVHDVRAGGDHHPAATSFFFDLTVLSSISASIFVGLSSNLSRHRYLQPYYVLPFFYLGIVSIKHYSRLPAGRRDLLLVLSALVSAIIIVPNALSLSITDFQTPYPDDVRCLDDFAREHGMRYAFSDYWNAKPSRFLSREGLEVNHWKRDLKPYYWLMNKRWYYGEDEQMIRPDNFIIITDRLDKDEIHAVYGRPHAKTYCGESEVYAYIDYSLTNGSYSYIGVD
ncbi:hypothetical protein ACFLRF_02335 [Candidatus Altiarchaeota archaeon]